MPRLLSLGLGGLLLLSLAGLGFGVYRYQRPIPDLVAAGSPPVEAGGEPIRVAWPASGQAALGVEGLGVVAASGASLAVPVRSVAKVMTALVVLDARPLQKGESGPTITIGGADVADYEQAVRNGESTVPVTAGEQLTEYQALEAMLVPSGNNIARTLAAWAVGSVPAAVQRMNERAAAMAMTTTHFDDPAGVADSTAGDASDVVRLGLEAMRNPVIADIVGRSEVQLPVAGTVPSTNQLLGSDGIVGVKTGSGAPGTAQYNLLFAANVQAGDRSVRMVGAVLGQVGEEERFQAARRLLDSARPGLEWRQMLTPGRRVGTVFAAWGATSPVEAASGAELLIWAGTPVTVDLAFTRLRAPLRAGTQVGLIRIQAGRQSLEVPAVAAATIDPPGVRWRVGTAR